jgi:hypothetical protein
MNHHQMMKIKEECLRSTIMVRKYRIFNLEIMIMSYKRFSFREHKQVHLQIKRKYIRN